MGERPTWDAPHPGKDRPPREPTCRPHSAQSQLARARVVGLVLRPNARTPRTPQRAKPGRAVGLVTGPHARNPRTHSQWVVGPGRTPQKMGGRGWESARPWTPHTQARGAPPGHPHAAPTVLKASSQERALWGWCCVPTPALPAPTASG